jgi:hypothetical protein
MFFVPESLASHLVFPLFVVAVATTFTLSLKEKVEGTMRPIVMLPSHLSGTVNKPKKEAQSDDHTSVTSVTSATYIEDDSSSSDFSIHGALPQVLLALPPVLLASVSSDNSSESSDSFDDSDDFPRQEFEKDLDRASEMFSRANPSVAAPQVSPDENADWKALYSTASLQQQEALLADMVRSLTIKLAKHKEQNERYVELFATMDNTQGNIHSLNQREKVLEAALVTKDVPGLSGRTSRTAPTVKPRPPLGDKQQSVPNTSLGVRTSRPPLGDKQRSVPNTSFMGVRTSRTVPSVKPCPNIADEKLTQRIAPILRKLLSLESTRVKDTLYELKRMKLSSNPQAMHKFITMGGCAISIMVMDKHVHDVDIMIKACKLVHHFTLDHFENKEAFCLMGGVVPILKAMIQFPESAEFQKVAFVALTSLTMIESGKLAVLSSSSSSISGSGNHGGRRGTGIATIVEIMSLHLYHKDICRLGCLILKLLFTSSKSHIDELIDHNGVQLITDIISHHYTDEQVERTARSIMKAMFKRFHNDFREL